MGPGFAVWQSCSLLSVGLAFALGACAMPDVDTFKLPDLSSFRPTAPATLRQTQLPPVTAEDLVDNDGRCAAAFVSVPVTTGSDPSQPGAQPASAPSGPAPAAATPLVAGGIGLDMTECEVVKRAGPPEKVEIGTNERSERTTVLTYIRGVRPGIYHFTSGRLTSMDRAPEPPPAPKPARKPKAKRTTT